MMHCSFDNNDGDKTYARSKAKEFSGIVSMA